MENTQNPNPPEQGDGLEDVEAHGLKEVAAGIGAAAVLGGAGAGAALAAQSTPMPQTVVGKVVHSVQATEHKAERALTKKTPAPPPDATSNNARTPAPIPLGKQLKNKLPHVTPPASNSAIGRGLQPTITKVTKTVQKTTKAASEAASKVLKPSPKTPPPQR